MDTNKLYDICIIGAGTAGLTAAIYALRAKKSIIVIESNTYGGQIINSAEIENYPGFSKISGIEFATKLYEQATNLGMELVYDRITSVETHDDFVISKGRDNEYKSKSIVVATGVANGKLNIPGEEEFASKGVSYCATCDGAFFRNKVTAVIGGGNTALKDVEYLANVSEKVYLIHSSSEFTASQKLLDDVKSLPNVSIITNAKTKSINGNNVVESLTYIDDKGDIKVIELSGIFVAVGQVPDTNFLSDVVDLDNRGYIITDNDCKTSVDRIYAAGDCRSKSIRQLTTATSDGAIASINAARNR